MFDFQLDIFETVMERFRNKLEVIIRSDVGLEASEENGLYTMRFNILIDNSNCFLYWVPRKYLVLDLYPALCLSNNSYSSLTALEELCEMAFAAGRNYALQTVVLVTGPHLIDEVSQRIHRAGFRRENGGSDNWVVRPVPAYLSLLRKESTSIEAPPDVIDKEAFSMASRLPRLVTDAAPYGGRINKGGVRSMSLG